MPSVDEAVRWAEGIAADDSYGYDQAARDSDHAVDCSSLVCRGLRHAGFGTPSPSFSTRTMGAWLESHGWVWHKGTSGVRRGDILWMSGHTAFAASSATIVEAYPHGTPLWGDERGDNNGREVLIDKLTVHAWAGYWRYTGEDDEVTDKDIEKIAQAVWNYELGSEGKMHYQNVPAWQHMSFAHFDTARLYKIATDTSDPTGRGVEMPERGARLHRRDARRDQGRGRVAQGGRGRGRVGACAPDNDHGNPLSASAGRGFFSFVEESRLYTRARAKTARPPILCTRFRVSQKCP